MNFEIDNLPFTGIKRRNKLDATCVAKDVFPILHWDILLFERRKFHHMKLNELSYEETA